MFVIGLSVLAGEVSIVRANRLVVAGLLIETYHPGYDSLL